MMSKVNRNSLSVVIALIAIVGAIGLGSGVNANAAARDVTRVVVETFQKPEVVPNTTLDITEDVRGSNAVLVRTENSLRAQLNTRDLPSGVYTFWWHLTHDDGEVSILWAGSSLVSNSAGTSHLNTVLLEDEEGAPGYIFIGHGLQPGEGNNVTVQLWVRTHGELSDDPELAEVQQTRPFGGCTDTRNPDPKVSDYPCWNPQRAVF